MPGTRGSTSQSGAPDARVPTSESGAAAIRMDDLKEMFASFANSMEGSIATRIEGLQSAMKEQVQEAVAAATTKTASPGAGLPNPTVLPDPTLTPQKRPFVHIPPDQSFDGKGDRRSAVQFLSNLEANYQSNRVYYSSPDDRQRVWDARNSLKEDALQWFDNTQKSDPSIGESFSIFVLRFRSTYMVGLTIERPLNKLRALRMSRGHVKNYTNVFNQCMGECASLGLPLISYITDYRLGLEKELLTKVEDSRVGLKGALVEWSTLEELQSTAVSLGESVSMGPVKVAAVILGQKGGNGKTGGRRETEAERQKRMAEKQCEWCGRRGHMVDECRDKINGIPGMEKQAGNE